MTEGVGTHRCRQGGIGVHCDIQSIINGLQFPIKSMT
jgi:hypothetical protein